MYKGKPEGVEDMTAITNRVQCVFERSKVFDIRREMQFTAYSVPLS